MKRFAAALVLAFIPPVTRPKVVIWATIPLAVAGVWIWIWFIATQVPGNTDVDSEVRWAADISGAVIYLGAIFFFPSARARGPIHRMASFRSGRVERAAIVGFEYGLQRGDRWIAIRLVAIRRIWRLFGVAAIELPSGNYWLVPSELFLSRADWAKVQQLLSSR